MKHFKNYFKDFPSLIKYINALLDQNFLNVLTFITIGI